MTQDIVAVLQHNGHEFLRETIAYLPSPGRPEPPYTGEGESSGSGEPNTISILNEVLETLKDDNINMIGIYGMDGVGMNNLVKNIQRRAKADNQFGEVAVAVVSKEGNIRNVQGEIADRLGLKFTEESVSGRAGRLCRRLVDDKKKLILLDDVCDRLDLEAIGIPFGGGEENKRCKIIVTSKNKRVCEEMKTQKDFKLEAEKEVCKATFGPFGGHGGDAWDDHAHTTVRSLIIVFNKKGICSLRTEYDDNGYSSLSSYHGLRCKPEHGETKKIVLNHPDEFLISVSGYYKAGRHRVIIHSLKFESNKQIFGPFGYETGHYFSSPPDVGKIIGFHGRASHYDLDSIGSYYEPVSSPTVYERTEVCGGRGGNLWDDGVFTTIRKIVIVTASVINSIRIEYDDNGRSVWSDLHGSPGDGSPGGQTHTVELDYPGEFLILISGYIREAPKSFVVIGSLKIHTNRKVYGPFGEENGTPFSLPSSHGKIIGFHGKCGRHLDSLGAYIETFPSPYPTCSIGPFGGSGGHLWDDGTFTTIRLLKLQINQVIESICIEYDKDGRSEWSLCHGKRGHTSIDPPSINLELDYPGEFLISVSGTYGLVSRWCVICSLTFESNRRTYGPFGTVSGQPFSTPSNSGKIVGFYGKSGSYIDSIGVHFQPL